MSMINPDQYPFTLPLSPKIEGALKVSREAIEHLRAYDPSVDPELDANLAQREDFQEGVQVALSDLQPALLLMAGHGVDITPRQRGEVA